MEALKKMCKAGSVSCLAGAALFSSVGAAVVSIVLASISVGIEIIDTRRK